MVHRNMCFWCVPHHHTTRHRWLQKVLRWSIVPCLVAGSWLPRDGHKYGKTDPHCVARQRWMLPRSHQHQSPHVSFPSMCCFAHKRRCDVHCAAFPSSPTPNKEFHFCSPEPPSRPSDGDPAAARRTTRTLEHEAISGPRRDQSMKELIAGWILLRTSSTGD